MKTKKITYLMNNFRFLLNTFKKHMPEYKFDYVFPKPSSYDFITNHLMYKKMQRKGIIQKYDVIQVNSWENFLNFKRVKNQFSIAESHGFHAGLNYQRFIQDEKSFIKKYGSVVLDKAIGKKIVEKINEFDLYYVSTPDMLSHAKKIRKDAIWLPNPVDATTFNEHGPKIKLEGDPAVFMPTRLHSDKNPRVGIELFKKIKKRYPKAALHLIVGRLNDEYESLKKELTDKDTYFWHNYMSYPDLAAFTRSADIVLGQFGIGTLSRIELQTMSCKTPLITLGEHQLKIKVKDMPDMAFKILENEKYKKKLIKDNFNLFQEFHSEESVAKAHMKNMKSKGFDPEAIISRK